MNKIGKIFNLKINKDTNELFITIKITDNKFKKEIIRDLDLKGKIKFDGDEIYYIEE